METQILGTTISAQREVGCAPASAPKTANKRPRKSRNRKTISSQPSNLQSPHTESISGISPFSTDQSRTIPSMPPSFGSLAPLFIASIGNPPPTYTNTLHSAGHTVLSQLCSYLRYPTLQKERSWPKALVSHVPSSSNESGSDWTLYQSLTYMNVCGKPLKSAFNDWLRNVNNISGAKPRLIVIHDELEKPLGNVSVRGLNGPVSAKGHNGLKSIMQAFGDRYDFVRIGVGIGRPVGRGSDEVANYVLKKMNQTEKMKIEGAVGQVVESLRRLERD